MTLALWLDVDICFSRPHWPTAVVALTSDIVSVFLEKRTFLKPEWQLVKVMYLAYVTLLKCSAVMLKTTS